MKLLDHICPRLEPAVIEDVEDSEDDDDMESVMAGGNMESVEHANVADSGVAKSADDEEDVFVDTVNVLETVDMAK